MLEDGEREEDWEITGMPITRNGEEIWADREPSPFDLGESEE